MKTFALGTLLLLNILATFAQTPGDIIARVKRAQKNIRQIAYTMKRTDTLVTGDVRSMSGSATIKPDQNDGVFGFLFRARLDGSDKEMVYDGHIGYTIGSVNKTYSFTSNKDNIRHMLFGGGGWFVMPDIIKIDTSKAVALNLSNDANYFYLKISYADYKPEDVIKRYKTLTISKKTFLPMAMRSHQETLGKVQDLYYQIGQIHINDIAFNYDFTLPILKEYQLEINTKAPPPPIFALQNKAAPQFILNNLNDSYKQTSLADYKAKVVLIDLWEVWCGPCIESMPKIQHLYDLYKDKGLQVLGIINDIKQLLPAKQLVKNRNYSFPMLVGNLQFKNDYKLNGAVPLYVLIDKSGQISFISQGYSTDIEAAIKKAIE